MDRAKFYALRHNARASGMDWNWGSRLRKGGVSYGPAKTPPLEMVLTTIPHKAYDKPMIIDRVNANSAHLMPLHWEWEQRKRRGIKTPRIWWQNFIRSAVRNQSRLFTEELISY